jgi:CheY-like chemotaxis protein
MPMNVDVSLLLAEGDEGHATLVRRNLERSCAGNVALARDGPEALDYVHGRGGCAPAAPVLLFVDIHMRRVDGVELLRRVKSGPATAQLPVIMRTTTDDQREVERCYQLGCSACITKPVQYHRLVEVIHRLGNSVELARLPLQDA